MRPAFAEVGVCCGACDGCAVRMFGGGAAPRTAFLSRVMAGFSQQKVETIAVGAAGERLFVGTADGSLLQYEVESTGDSYECRLVETLRKVSKERKPVQSLQVVEAWRALVGIVDGFLVAYDIYTRMPLAQIAESKGCTIYALHAPSRQLCVAVKKRILVFGWQQTSFVARREVSVSEQPRAMICTADICCFALKKEYVSLSLSTGQLSKALDMDREHRYATLVEVPPIPSRPSARVLASIGERGVFLEIEEGKLGHLPEDRITWSAAPRMVQVVLPYIVSLLANDKVEIHDVSSLLPVQTVDAAVGPLAMCSCKMGVGKAENVFVGSATAVQVLKMVPLAQQVEQLVASGSYEDAIAICSMFEGGPDAAMEDRALLADIDLHRIHELYADMLFAKHSYDDAVIHYIKAETPVGVVCAHFNLLPDDLPLPQRVKDMVARKVAPINQPNLTGSQLNRACTALLVFLQHHRKEVKEAADRVELLRSGRATDSRAGRGMDDEEDASEAIMTAVMVDTLIITCALRCKPPRRDETVVLLSGPNRCHIDSCTPLLAAEGPAFVEALLWLYRSKGEHRRALGLLTEERCVARERGKGWTLMQFQSWMADYLHSLWHAKDPSLPPVVLPAAKPLLEGNPKLGLSVFISMDGETADALSAEGGGVEGLVGGRGVHPQDVLNLLKSITPRVSEAEWKGPGGLKKASKSLFYRSPGSQIQIPLVSGVTLAMAYLDWLVAVGGAPPELHDEFFLLLLTGLLSEEKEAAQQGRAPSEDGRSPTELGRVFQEKLREFLRTSTSYHPERLLPALEGLPSHFLHEHALLLSKLGRHEEVLRIYVDQMKNHEMAEAYCDEIWRRSLAGTGKAASTGQQQQQPRRRTSGGSSSSQQHPLGGRSAKEDADVYLALLNVYLKEDYDLNAPTPPRWLTFLERNFARLDAVRVLQMVPDKATPLKAVSGYLCKVLRHCSTERRHKEVVHQLLRVEELKIQQELIQEQSRRVVVTESTVCGVPTCKRLIGNTAILCYPNGTVVHFACGRNDLHTCPVTGKRFGTPATAFDASRK